MSHRCHVSGQETFLLVVVIVSNRAKFIGSSSLFPVKKHCRKSLSSLSFPIEKRSSDLRHRGCFQSVLLFPIEKQSLDSHRWIDCRHRSLLVSSSLSLALALSCSWGSHSSVIFLAPANIYEDNLDSWYHDMLSTQKQINFFIY